MQYIYQQYSSIICTCSCRVICIQCCISVKHSLIVCICSTLHTKSTIGISMVQARSHRIKYREIKAGIIFVQNARNEFVVIPAIMNQHMSY